MLLPLVVITRPDNCDISNTSLCRLVTSKVGRLLFLAFYDDEKI